MFANSLSINMPRSAQAPRGRVLCVGDEPNILRALSWLLNKDFQAITAGSALEGIELARTGDFDVVISDQHMEEMSGDKFLAQIGIESPRTKRILLTENADNQPLPTATVPSSIIRRISKPWDVVELPAIVAQAAATARAPAIAPVAAVPRAEMPLIHRRIKLLVLDDDETIHSAVEMSAGDLAEIIHVTNPVDALRIMANDEVGVILAERMLGSMDLTHLLCLLKRQYPQIVCVVLDDMAESKFIENMVSDGQIFRVVQKPVKAGLLRQTLRDAVVRRNELLGAPLPDTCADLDDRNPASDGSPLPQRISQPAPDARDTETVGSIFGRIGFAMRRMFGS